MLDISALSPVINKLPGRMAGPEARIDATAREFEALFLSQMLEQMFGESIGDELFGDAETSEVYKGLMMEQYGKHIVASGGIGIAPYVKQELLKLQEV